MDVLISTSLINSKRLFHFDLKRRVAHNQTSSNPDLREQLMDTSFDVGGILLKGEMVYPRTDGV